MKGLSKKHLEGARSVIEDEIRSETFRKLTHLKIDVKRGRLRSEEIDTDESIHEHFQRIAPSK